MGCVGGVGEGVRFVRYAFFTIKNARLLNLEKIKTKRDVTLQKWHSLQYTIGSQLYRQWPLWELAEPEVVRICPERVRVNRPDFRVDQISPSSAKPINTPIVCVASHDVTFAVAWNWVLRAVCQLGQDPVDVVGRCVGYKPRKSFHPKPDFCRQAEGDEKVWK